MPPELTESSITHRLLGRLVTQGMGTVEAAAILARIGMSNKDIAAVLDTTESTVRGAASKAKTGGKLQKKVRTHER